MQFKASALEQVSFREKWVLRFALLDEWNVNNSIEKVKVYFSIVFYDKDIKVHKFFDIKEKKTLSPPISESFLETNKWTLLNKVK